MTWYNNDWGFRKQITIDSDNVSSDLTDFPVLIHRKSDSDLEANDNKCPLALE